MITGGRRASLVAVATLTTVLLSGCSMQWASMSKPLNIEENTKIAHELTKDIAPQATPTASPSATATASATPVKTRVPADLDSGSTSHVLSAGSTSLVVDYWSQDNSSTWKPNTENTVQLSAHLENANPKLISKVSNFIATITYEDGTVQPLTRDDGEFVITPPFSYSSAMQVNTKESASAKINLQWNILVETAPKSGQFFRQTVIDTLTINFADPTTESQS